MLASSRRSPGPPLITAFAMVFRFVGFCSIESALWGISIESALCWDLNSDLAENFCLKVLSIPSEVQSCKQSELYTVYWRQLDSLMEYVKVNTTLWWSKRTLPLHYMSVGKVIDQFPKGFDDEFHHCVSLSTIWGPPNQKSIFCHCNCLWKSWERHVCMNMVKLLNQDTLLETSNAPYRHELFVTGPPNKLLECSTTPVRSQTRWQIKNALAKKQPPPPKKKKKTR